MNWIAIIVCAVIAMALGYLWYSPILFAKQWMKLSGMTKEKMDKAKDKMPMIYGGQFITAIVEIWVLSMFIQFTGVADPVLGAIVALWAWLGFIATIGVGEILFNGRDLRLVAINSGYQLVFLLISGIILGGWK